MWEVFTCGKVPYGRMMNTEVVDKVQRGQVLEKPKGCLNEIYNVSDLYYLVLYSNHSDTPGHLFTVGAFKFNNWILSRF